MPDDFTSDFLSQSVEEEQAQENSTDVLIAIYAGLFPQIRDLLSRRMGSMPPGTHILPKRTQERLVALLDAIEKRQRQTYSDVFAKQLEQLRQQIRIQWNFTRSSFNRFFNIDDLNKPPTNDILSEILNRPMSQVGSLKEWQKLIRNRGITNVRKQIETLYRQGLSETEIIANVVGTAKNKYTDGMFAKLSADIKTMGRTANTHAITAIRDVIYRNNKDRIKGVRWVSVLDSRTSLICASLDGSTYPVDSGPRPPAHPNCRSRTVPIVEGFEEDSEREITFKEWFEEQSEDFKKEYLGPARYKLYQKGSISLDSFVRSNRVLTIDELETISEGR